MSQQHPGIWVENINTKYPPGLTNFGTTNGDLSDDRIPLAELDNRLVETYAVLSRESGGGNRAVMPEACYNTLSDLTPIPNKGLLAIGVRSEMTSAADDIRDAAEHAGNCWFSVEWLQIHAKKFWLSHFFGTILDPLILSSCFY